MLVAHKRSMEPASLVRWNAYLRIQAAVSKFRMIPDIRDGWMTKLGEEAVLISFTEPGLNDRVPSSTEPGHENNESATSWSLAFSELSFFPSIPTLELRESNVLQETFHATDLDANSVPRPDIMSDDEVIHVRGSVVWATSRIQNSSITLRAFFSGSVDKNSGRSSRRNHLRQDAGDFPMRARRELQRAGHSCDSDVFRRGAGVGGSRPQCEAVHCSGDTAAKASLVSGAIGWSCDSPLFPVNSEDSS